MVAFELAVQDLEGAAAAARLGADRIELCSALTTGGVTPSLGLIEAAADEGVPVHVLVRPRGGDFSYSREERAVIVRDIGHALSSGASGVVVGGVRDGLVDQDLMRAAMDAAGSAEVTFHRALDTLSDRIRALDVLTELGVQRVLTSGGADRALEGRGELERLARHAGERIQIMAGGGVTADNVAELVSTGVAAVHASAKRTLPGSGVALGSSGASVRETVDEEHARRLLAAIGRGGEA